MKEPSSKARDIGKAVRHSDFHQSCDEADQAISEVAQRFDFLLSVSPTNTVEAMQDWFGSGAKGDPKFEYRGIDFDVAALRRELHEIELTHIHEPLVEGLLIEKRQELDTQLAMLEQRCTGEFPITSKQLYGAVSDRLRDVAASILSGVKTAKTQAELVGASELQSRAQAMADAYALQDEGFQPNIEIRDDVSGLLVSYPKLMIDADAKVSARRVDPLLSHEMSVHMVTGFNGAQQPLSLFASGLAGYEEIQEGLGVFAEWAVGGLYDSRLRLIAARVIAVHAMLNGATFTECHRELVTNCGVAKRAAFKVCARIYRGGGFAKDAIYMRGFFRVMEFIAEGGSLNPYWYGKIAPIHCPIVEQLEERGLAVPARIIPEFLTRPSAKARIEDYIAEPLPEKWLSPEPATESPQP